MKNWALFHAETGNELTRGWQGYGNQARRMAQRRANELGAAVELIAESELGHGEGAGEPPTGEIVEPDWET